jgi:Uma2 family endonuclease
MVAPAQLVTLEEFERFIAQPEQAHRLFELIDGEIVEKMPTREHGIIALNVGADLDAYLDSHPIGQAAVEARHRPTDDRLNDRLPDVSFVSGSRPVETEGAANYIPDLCVEIRSPADTLRDMLAKADFYLRNGGRMVWLIYPEQRIVEVLTQQDRQLLTENSTLTGGDVLPEFSIPVSRIFRRL